MRISEHLNRLLASLLSTDKLSFSRVAIQQEVVEGIIEFANSNYPREFVAALDGKIQDGSLVITGLLYQPFQSSRHSALMKQNLPMTSSAVGIVHSHPSPNNRPSGQDLRLFAKGGVVHIIIGYPFTEKSLACYDLHGQQLPFEIQP